MFKPVNNNQSLPNLEKEILSKWQQNHTFLSSVEARKNGAKYVFFDGPPFANGLPHYGHILAASLKDAVTRYWNMKGYYVPRTNGWDCHGLPVEYEIEKELELSGKKEIEKFGVENFNNACRESVFRYTNEWRDTIERIGRWVDFDETYATLDNDYMESIWWVLKQIWNKGLVYQNFRSMHICPRCETPLSNFEVSLGYKEVTDLSVIAKFKLNNPAHPNTFILAWTTTPWTLPGNMALCLGPDIEYVKIKAPSTNQAEEFYIMAKQLVGKLFPEQEPEIVAEIKASELEGETYEPLFPYYANETDKKRFQVVLADFVTTEDGTGIVHIAAGYGADDFEVAQKYELDPIMHVGMNGEFKAEVSDFAGKFVKGQDHNVAEYLAENGLLFNKQNYRHSYPHCWRCDSPLLNFSLKSWFVAVSKIKDKLLKNNEKINWQPNHIKDGRFGQWLENVRDWNISRNRFWGCAMPVWECQECDHQVCLESVRDLRIRSKNGNKLYFVRHGEADHNLKQITNSDPHDLSNLTEQGIEQAKNVAAKLKEEGITMIYSSPFPRAMQTAEIIAAELGLQVKTDERIRELNEPHNTPFTELIEARKSCANPFTFRSHPDSESIKDVLKRVLDFVDYLAAHESGENVLVVTHGAVVNTAINYFEDKGFDNAENFSNMSKLPHDAVYTYYSGKVPQRDGELDLHKPYIDEIELTCDKCSTGTMRRIPEVLDCWFESGAMPYASLHYPFENKREFENNFPAQFIAEGLDQTRGWFYTLHVLSTILFDEPSAQNIIVNGILLAKDGEKMSKRKKNYPDPNELFAAKGVDAVRLFMYQSTAPQAEDVRFSDDAVDEVFKKFSLTLWNTYSFFVTYANIDNWKPDPETIANFTPENELDQWILSELQTTIAETTTQMDQYNLTRATRPFTNFVDNLSNWYIRRSRRRFWKSDNDQDKTQAYNTLYIVLTEFCKIIAPFTPFIADGIYSNLTNQESVHLCDWPTVNEAYHRPELNEKTQLIRQVVSLGHNIRAKENLKVRQPLGTIEVVVANKNQEKEILAQQEVILEELNIKNLILSDDVSEKVKLVVKPNARVLGPKYGNEMQKIIQAAKAGQFEQASDKILVCGYELTPDEYEIGYEAMPGISAESEQGLVVILHTEITPELEAEGLARDLVRVVQDMRKKADYNVADRIQLLIKTSDTKLNAAITQFGDYIKTETLSLELINDGELIEADQEQKVELEGFEVTVAVKKSAA